ncbi:MAG TPA: helix-turn-helix domain-containing protein [Burkholderiales bacterium]
MDPLLTEQQVADLLGVSVRTLQDQRFRGVGIPFVRVGRLVRYERAVVEQYIRANRRISTRGASLEVRP